MDLGRVQIGQQQEMTPCRYCHALLRVTKRPRKFCNSSCKAAFHRENGIVVVLTGARRMKKTNRIALDTDDERVLTAPLGTKWQLVKVPS